MKLFTDNLFLPSNIYNYRCSFRTHYSQLSPATLLPVSRLLLMFMPPVGVATNSAGSNFPVTSMTKSTLVSVIALSKIILTT